jgi:hypothetical protein
VPFAHQQLALHPGVEETLSCFLLDWYLIFYIWHIPTVECHQSVMASRPPVCHENSNCFRWTILKNSAEAFTIIFATYTLLQHFLVWKGSVNTRQLHGLNDWLMHVRVFTLVYLYLHHTAEGNPLVGLNRYANRCSVHPAHLLKIMLFPYGSRPVFNPRLFWQSALVSSF